MEQSSNKVRGAYVELTNNGTVLTFYYDTLCDTREGETCVLGCYKNPGIPFWSDNKDLELVIFDASFKDYFSTRTDGWFYRCINLKEIQGLENLNTDKVEKMYSMFNGCASLRSLDLSHFKTARVRDMHSMFSGCSSLVTLNVSSFNTTNVSDMLSMFSGCSSLVTLNVSSFNTDGVTDMNSMFSDCSSLVSLDLSSFNTTSVTDMDSMFSDCSSLVSLDISNFDTSNVEKMSEMFINCSALTTIYCNYEWQLKGARSMFSDCVKLKGAVPYNMMKDGGDMANPETGYFTYKTEETESSAETTQVPVGGVSTAPQQESALEGCSWFTLQGTPLEGRFEDLPAGMYIVKKN